MMSLVHLISAKRRLKELEKTVTLLKHDKYSESDVPTMVLAQRDFVKLEVEYYKESVSKLILWLIIIFVTTLLFLVPILKLNGVI
jgi:hypothetical protein